MIFKAWCQLNSPCYDRSSNVSTWLHYSFTVLYSLRQPSYNNCLLSSVSNAKIARSNGSTRQVLQSLGSSWPLSRCSFEYYTPQITRVDDRTPPSHDFLGKRHTVDFLSRAAGALHKIKLGRACKHSNDTHGARKDLLRDLYRGRTPDLRKCRALIQFPFPLRVKARSALTAQIFRGIAERYLEFSFFFFLGKYNKRA